MKTYRVKVNGKIYEVELEEIKESKDSIKQSKTKEDVKPSEEHSAVKAPMQGTIQKILVSPGAHVKKGQALLILEAMKLENEITAERDYTILDILIKEGDSVSSQQSLFMVS